MHRRTLLTGLGAFAVAPAAAGAAEAAGRWLDYEKRLRSRLLDTGGGVLQEHFASELVTLTNRLRAQNGVPALHVDPELTTTARAHAADMAGRKFFAHNSPEGFNANERVGLLVRKMMGSFGENLAYQTGFNRKVTPKMTFEGWRDSPGHRENMLESKYSHVGHAVVKTSETYYSVAVFGGRDASLSAPLPLRLDGPQLHAALRAAQPQIERYMISEPEGPPQRPGYASSGSGPAYPPGVWRVRPIAPIGPGRIAVLWGPAFVV